MSESAANSNAGESARSIGRLGPRGSHQPALLGAASVGAGLLVWEAVARTQSAVLLASPFATLQKLGATIADGSLPTALWASLGHMALGYLIAVVIAIPVGLAMGRSRIVHALLDPVVTLIYAVPSVAWAPFIMIWCGLFFEARVALVVIMCVFDMIIVVDAGARDVSPRLLDVGRAYGARRWQLTRLVLLPACLPFLLTALRIGAIRAVNAMITAELFLATVNLGGIMKQASARFDAAGVLSVLVVLALLGLAVQELLLLLERHTCRWLVRSA
ncbi:ABC transporter permease [Robbsia sp. KACC 23696]|uniref:ABC transporter permease n=1 Tax=Robbsia sp. KACC 23696 TaxID=3149231 RepID=UPI00325AF59D